MIMYTHNRATATQRMQLKYFVLLEPPHNTATRRHIYRYGCHLL